MGFINVFIEWLFAVTLAAGGALMARALLAYFDYKTGGRFDAWVSTATTGDLAIYYGARFVGVCLLFGLALS